jgi:hypothetical protein
LASLHVAKSSGAGPSACGRAELGGGIGSSAERVHYVLRMGAVFALIGALVN